MDSILPGADESEELENGSSDSGQSPEIASSVESEATNEAHTELPIDGAEASLESDSEPGEAETTAAPESETETLAQAEAVEAAPAEQVEAAPAEQIETAAEVPAEQVEAAAEAPAEQVEVAAEVPAEQVEVAAEAPAEQAETAAEVPAEQVEAAAEAPAEQAEAAAEASAEQVEAAAPAEQVEAAAEAPADSGEHKLESPLKRGEIHDGTIVATSPTSVQVDVAGLATGIIPGRELERMNRETLDLLKPGEMVPVYIVNPHDHRGNVILSINRALEELDWRKAEEYRENKSVYESRIAGYNKGGLIVRFGRVRGFVPQSQISADRRATMDGATPEERWGEMVNQPIAVKVMEVDRDRNRLILSERAAAREIRESRKEDLIEDLEVGEIRTGRVVSLVDFGAFVNIGGAEGLVHLTELAWHHVTHAREVLKVGDEVKVEVISIEPDRKRIGLSIRRLMEDPWDTVAIEYNVGQLVQGKITKLTKFGAFAQLVDAPAIEGLIHISELSDERVNHPREVVNEGETLTLRVVKMDIERRRLGLSLKAVNSAEYLDQDWDY